MGGEAYITCKPDLIKDVNKITDGRQFLQSFVNQFADLVVRINGRETRVRAA
jgi:hypothetical protein